MFYFIKLMTLVLFLLGTIPKAIYTMALGVDQNLLQITYVLTIFKCFLLQMLSLVNYLCLPPKNIF